MDRKEIKELAKQKVKGNKWKILWPLLVISLVGSILTSAIGPNYDYSSIDFENFNKSMLPQPTVIQSILTLLVGFVIGFANVAYNKYILKFVRGENAEFSDIVDTVKEKWLQILLSDILVTVIVWLFSLLLVIPGIIRALSYAMVGYLVVDTDLEAKDVLKKSREMMNGYKWNYFVYSLSFIGWFLLVPFTFGIILIWLIPYIIVANTLYYEKLKEING